MSDDRARRAYAESLLARIYGRSLQPYGTTSVRLHPVDVAEIRWILQLGGRGNAVTVAGIWIVTDDDQVVGTPFWVGDR